MNSRMCVLCRAVDFASLSGGSEYSVTVREPADVNLDAALRDAREALAGVPQVADKPAPQVVPQLDGKAVLLRCTYWVDQSAHEPDAVSVEVARRLWPVARPAPSGGEARETPAS